MFNRDVLDAERELGRLTELLDSSDLSPLWRADAIRREVVGSFALDGRAVEMEDLAVASIDRYLLPVLQREDFDEPAQLAAILHGTIAGGVRSITPTISGIERAPRPNPRDDISSLVAAVRASTRSVEAFVADLVDDDLAAGPINPQPRSSLLSSDWFSDYWFGLYGSEIPQSVLRAGLEGVDTVSRGTGLIGVLSAIFALHLAAPLAGQTGCEPPAPLSGSKSDRRGWRFARALVPFFISRGCSVPLGGPWFSWFLRHDSLRYSRLIEADDESWSDWVMSSLADSFRFERTRLARLGQLVSGWEHRFADGGKRRWQSNVRLLNSLVLHPVVTTKFVHRLRGGDLRSAQLLVKELRECGIVHRVHYSKGREWFVASEVLLR